MAKQFGNRARKNRFSSLLNRRSGGLKGSGASFSRLLRIESLESRQMLSANGFSQNDLVVDRYGDGSAALTSASTAVFLDEFNTSGTAVNTLALPTAAGGGSTPNPLTGVGNSTSEGFMTRSVDGRFLTVPGYATAPGLAAVAGTSTTTTTGGGPVLRDVGLIDGNGAIDTTTTTTRYSAGNIRGVVSTDGANFWETGSVSGVTYETPLGSSGLGTLVFSTTPNLRATNIFNGELYYTSASAVGGNIIGLSRVGSGTPTTTGQAATNMIATGGSPYGFAISPDGKTIYIADDTASAVGGIYKYTSTTGAAGSFSLAYATPLGTGAANIGARGIVVDFSGANPIIYATTAEGSANRLIKIVDTGVASTATTLATAPANTAFHGVAFAPFTAGTTALDILPSSVSHSEGNSGATPFAFTVRRTGDVSGTASVNWAVTGSGASPANGTDFVGGVLPTGSVSFAAGESTKTVTVNVQGDLTFEGDDTFTVTLSNASGTGVSLGTQTAATGTIIDDDGVANFSVAANAGQSSHVEGNSGTVSYTFTVTRSVLTTNAVTVDWAVTGTGAHPADATDFGGTLPSGTLNFGIGVTTQTITVNVTGDTTVESDETFNVTLANPLPDGAINGAPATATIVNDDTFVFISADQTSKAEGNSGATPFTFTLTRSGLTTGTSDVDWAVSGSGTNAADGADFVGGSTPSGTVHFAAGDTTKQITINVQGDVAFETNEGFTVTMSNPVGTNISATTPAASTTILNDDFQALGAGDVLITGINGTNPDQFVFVPLVDLQPNASINFTDDAWDGAALRTNEGVVTYTAPAGGLPKGSTIILQVDTSGVPSIVIGSGTVAATGAGTFSLIAGGENLLAYIGLSTAPTFLFAVTTNDSYLTTGSPGTGDTYLPPGLVIGTSAVAPLDVAVGAAPDVNNAQYNTIHGLTGTPDQLRALVANSANWDVDTHAGTVADPATPFSFDTTNYTVNAPTSTGDYNHNGFVDAADYIIYRKTLGTSVTPFSGADGDGSGVIDAGDLAFWKAHFGNTVPGAGSGAEVADSSESAAPQLARLVAVATPVSVAPVASVTSSAHDEAFVSLAAPSATTHHGFGAAGSTSDGGAGGFRAAWLQGLLLGHAGNGKPQDSVATRHAGGSTDDSSDTDAVDHCFATLGTASSLLN